MLMNNGKPIDASAKCDAMPSSCERRVFARMPSLADAVLLAKDVDPSREWTAAIRDDRLLFCSPGLTWAEVFAFKDAIEKRLPDGLEADVSSIVWP